MAKRKRPNPAKIRDRLIKDAKACTEKQKIPYATQEQALQRISEIEVIRPWTPKLKAYRCSFCKSWHLAKALNS